MALYVLFGKPGPTTRNLPTKRTSTQFPKRKGINSLYKCFEKYKLHYIDIDLTLKTKAKKEQVTQNLSYNMVGVPLMDIPLDVISPASMHVILGLTKNV